MIVNVDITLGLDIEINQPMAGDLIQHVIEERDARLERRAAAAIEVDGHPNLGF